ncbi:MAG: Diacetyl reductase [(S)-acetoin forming] [Nitrospira sp.]|nr:Diacetyl reductase [(S)-acetoin forming] [Nitrospira sp.]
MVMESVNRVAFVSGASRGIGRAVATRLARDGFDVAVSARTSEALDGVVNDILSLGRSVVRVPAVVSDRDQVFGAVRKAVNELGRIDVMVANAGIVQTQDIVDVRRADLDEIVQTNIYGAFWSLQAAGEAMIPQGSGKIILASSIAGHEGLAHFSAYCATKFAINGITHAAAKEFAPFGITVNAICPGIVDTDMWIEVDAALSAMQGRQPGEAVDERAKDIALGRVQTPEDCAGFVSYLASTDADYMTGQCLVFDGGVIFR